MERHGITARMVAEQSAFWVWSAYGWPLGPPPEPPLTHEEWKVIEAERHFIPPGAHETTDGVPGDLIVSMLERGFLTPFVFDGGGNQYVTTGLARNELIRRMVAAG